MYGELGEDELGLSPSKQLQEKEKQIMGRGLCTKNKTKPRSIKSQKCMGRKGILSLSGKVILEVRGINIIMKKTKTMISYRVCAADYANWG